MQKGANCSVGEFALILGSLSLLGLVAAMMPPLGRVTVALAPVRTIELGTLARRSAPIFIGTTVLLLAAQPLMQAGLGQTFATVANLLITPRMNQQGNAILEQGYYENLTNAARLNPELAELYAQTPPDWPGESPVRFTKDWMIFEVMPSRVFNYYRTKVTTNRWGMRDREYDLAKPPGTIRIGLFGESHTFGNGVPDHLIYKQLVEDRINELDLLASGQRVQMMNFSTPGYGPIFKFAYLETKGFRFDLDAVVQTAVSNEKEWAVKNLTGAVIEGTPIPYPFLTEIVAKAGVNKDMTPPVINHRLGPYRDDLIRWVYAQLADACRRHGVRPYLLFLPKPEYDLGREQAFKELAQIAESNGIGVLDISHAYDGERDLHSMWVAPWDNHPNVRGHQLLADEFLRVVQGPVGRELLTPAAEASPTPRE